jgi:hypothetical protein
MIHRLGRPARLVLVSVWTTCGSLLIGRPIWPLSSDIQDRGSTLLRNGLGSNSGSRSAERRGAATAHADLGRHRLYIIVNHRDYPVRSTGLNGPPHADLDHNRGRGGPGAVGPRGIRHEPHAEMARLIRIAPARLWEGRQ